MARNLEDSCNMANAKYVSINRDDREQYAAHFSALKDAVYSHWKGSGVLGKLLKGTTLGGGYGDKVKVSVPDEYDLVIHLVFPENDKIIVKADASKPGNVILDMSKVMEIIGNQAHNKPVFDLLQKIVNNKKQLLEDKLQSFLQGIMNQTLNKMCNQIEVQGKISKLTYKKCGPAHTIFVEGPCEYSVDFVPAIKLSAAQVILAPEQRKHFGGTLYWDAVPKPMKPAKCDNISFRASFYEAERRLLHGKQFLKSGIRLMKQNRNVKNKANLKSYHIKTVFLWQLIEKDASYWQKPVKDILIEMMSKLADSLALTPRKGRLPFFWDPKLDMFADLTDCQRIDMFNYLRKCEYTFRKADGNLNDDNENNVQNSFSSARNKGAENRPSDGQKKENTTKESKPASAEPTKSMKTKVAATPPAKASTKTSDAKTQLNEQKKPLAPATSNPKSKTPITADAKVSPAPSKANPNPSEQKVKSTPVKPNPKPNVQQQQANRSADQNRINPNANGAQPKADANSNSCQIS
ncbi:uncharacterized protein LOC6531519 [Drosophila yakuba]|uniref:Uncharacterized protein n=1 Tax=Drosophila yakuba TaxID=7245 RepID=B4P6V3_DROYA|nr:uncharacterized protein LOC6531519 [Drosophila yakuba]EDW92030.1 uncharacterized protein Dyak_GE11736 [Drosophila yakuba]